jgi:hypothetical protein
MKSIEIDPLTCPKCGQGMKVVSFIDPPQAEVRGSISIDFIFWA